MSANGARALLAGTGEAVLVGEELVLLTHRESMKRVGSNGWVSAAELSSKLDKDPDVFFVVTRGFFHPDGSRYWTRFATMPFDAELLSWLASECASGAVRASGGKLGADDVVAQVAEALGVRVTFDEEPEEDEGVVVG